MPYIAPDERPQYDEHIRRLAEILSAKPPEQRKGHGNYVVTRILRAAWGVTEAAEESYSNYADVVGTLECSKLEIYRRWVAPYEDRAIERNGDV